MLKNTAAVVIILNTIRDSEKTVGCRNGKAVSVDGQVLLLAEKNTCRKDNCCGQAEIRYGYTVFI